MAASARFQEFASLSVAARRSALARCRERAASLGRQLNAVVSLCDEAPAEDGALAFMPYAAKDVFDNGVSAPTWGCAKPVRSVAPAAPVLHRLHAAGAQCIAIAEMTQLAYEPSGQNDARGRVVNPWRRDIACGGSSSGSAALVAAGCCTVALGTDTGGSVRIPAHCCGVTALKPTWGAIPVDGVMALAPSLDTVGLMARGAADIGAVWPVVATMAGAPARVRSAAILIDAFGASDAGVAEICRQAVDELAGLGVAVVDRAGFPDEADREALLVMQAEAARTHRQRFDDDRLDPVLRRRLSKGLAISDADLAGANGRRRALRERFAAEALGDADVVLLPVMPIETPPITAVDPRQPTFDAKTLYAMSRFTRFVNYLGLPALAVPAGFDGRGLPVALQIVGREDSDATLIGLGAALQSHTDWHGRVPTAVAADIAAEGTNA